LTGVPADLLVGEFDLLVGELLLALQSLCSKAREEEMRLVYHSVELLFTVRNSSSLSDRTQSKEEKQNTNLFSFSLNWGIDRRLEGITPVLPSLRNCKTHATLHQIFRGE
jgi:hypothetical protein